MKRLIIVSNRVAPVKEGAATAGGLAVAILATLRKTGGLWFGWNGEICDATPKEPTITKSGRLTFATLPLPHQDHEEYYIGFANRVLWPLFHYRPGLTSFSLKDLEGYHRVNRLFTKLLIPLLREDDIIWVHDYHLIAMGKYLRKAGIRQPIGFFLHTPFPAMEILITLPNHSSLVKSLCAYDLIGFQTANDLQSFHDYVIRELNGEVLEDGIVRAFGSTFLAKVFPIGIDTEAISHQSAKAASTETTKRLQASLVDRDLIIGVDRLDYSKGLVERFNAFDHFLERYPENRRRVVFLQIAPPSRTDVPEYNDIRENLEALAGSVNGRYAEFDWMPIRYLNKGFNQRTLTGFFRISRVGLVTPLRDGMNLVAKEYVAAQNPTDPGVLVLSRFAGAARELDSAVIVNPFDAEGMANAIQRALGMSLSERLERWEAMIGVLRKNNVTVWHNSFLQSLREACQVLHGK